MYVLEERIPLVEQDFYVKSMWAMVRSLLEAKLLHI